MPNPITPQQYEPAFDIAKEMFRERISRKSAIEALAKTGINTTSAAFLLNALLAMRRGVVFKKTMSVLSARYYLERFIGELKAEEFASVLRSVGLHIHYYNKHHSGKLVKFAALLGEFETTARSHYGQAFGCNILSTAAEQNEAQLAVFAPESSNDAGAENATEAVFHEGALKTIELTVHERDPAARRVCIAHFGPTCQICDFDFERTYGELGRGFIHVHHRVDLALADDVREVNPITDLIPVCPNCHAMLHSETPAMDPSKLKTLIKAEVAGK